MSESSISPGSGGWLCSMPAEGLGYPAAFKILGCFTIGSIVIWLLFASVLKPACAGSEGLTAPQFQSRRPNR
jgi:hypothetical protein